MGLFVLVVVVSVFWRRRPARWERAGDGELADRFAPLRGAGGGPPALVLGFARLPKQHLVEAVRLLAEAAATGPGMTARRAGAR